MTRHDMWEVASPYLRHIDDQGLIKMLASLAPGSTIVWADAYTMHLADRMHKAKLIDRILKQKGGKLAGGLPSPITAAAGWGGCMGCVVWGGVCQAGA